MCNINRVGNWDDTTFCVQEDTHPRSEWARVPAIGEPMPHRLTESQSTLHSLYLRRTFTCSPIRPTPSRCLSPFLQLLSHQYILADSANETLETRSSCPKMNTNTTPVLDHSFVLFFTLTNGQSTTALLSKWETSPQYTFSRATIVVCSLLLRWQR